MAATRRSKRILRLEPEELTARVVSFYQNYFIARSEIGSASFVDDEAAIELDTVIETISDRHRKHVGQPFAMRLLSSRRYKDGAHSEPSFFGSVTLRGTQRSALAYLPADPFWHLPQLIQREARFIQLRFSPLSRGHADLMSLFIGCQAETG